MNGRVYSTEEKLTYVDEFKTSGITKAEFSRLKNIPVTTLKNWLRLDKAMEFGEINLSEPTQEVAKPVIKKTTVFAGENIRIELKEGFDKQFLRKIVEVLINDS